MPVAIPAMLCRVFGHSRIATSAMVRRSPSRYARLRKTPDVPTDGLSNTADTLSFTLA